MFTLRGLFSNKHRAYLLIFALSFLTLRLPILITNKIERVLIGKLAEVSKNTGTALTYENLNVNFPANIHFPTLIIAPKDKGTFVITNLTMQPKFTYPVLVEVRAEVAKGSLSCKISRGFFSSELGLNCSATDIETSEVPQLQEYHINGPLSFKFTGTANANQNLFNLAGEFLSQVDTSKLVPPKALPSFIKLPDFGLIDAKGQFDLKGTQLSLKDVSLASNVGDVGILIASTFDQTFREVTDLNSTFNVKLSASGIQSVGPWLGLLLGGQQFPSSGAANILVTGNSKNGFKAKLGS